MQRLLRGLALSAIALAAFVGSTRAGAVPDHLLGPNEIPWERPAVGRILAAVARGDEAAVATEVAAWDADPVALAYGAFVSGLVDGADAARALAAAKSTAAKATRAPGAAALAALVEAWGRATPEERVRERRLVEGARLAQRLVRENKGREALAALAAAKPDVAAAGRSPAAIWLRNIDRSIGRAPGPGEDEATANARAVAAREAALELPWPECAAIVDMGHGIAIRRRGGAAQAEAALTAWIENRPAELSPYRVATLRSARCDARLERDRLESALEDARAAASTFASNGAASLAAVARGSVARALQRLGRIAEATAEGLAARAAAEVAGNDREVARSGVLLGLLAIDEGRLPASIARFREAVAAAERAKATDVLAHALSNLAYVERLVGDARASIAAYDRVIELRRASGDLVGLARAATVRAGAVSRFDSPLAVRELKALDAEFAGRVTDAVRGVLRLGIAQSMREGGISDAEGPIWTEAIALLEQGAAASDLVFAKASLARLRVEQGRAADALALLDGDDVRGAHVDSGARYEAGLSLGLARLESGDARGAFESLAATAERAASLAAGTGDADSASRTVGARRASEYLLAAAMALPEADRAAATWTALETGRAITLAGALVQRDALLAARIPAEVRDAERTSRAGVRRALDALARAALGTGSKGADGLGMARANLDAAVAERSRALARLGREARIEVEALAPARPDLDVFRATLGADEAFVAWHVSRRVGPPRLVGIAVTRAKSMSVDLGEEAPLRARIEGWLDLLSASGSKEAGTAAALHDALVRPMEAVLGAATRWYVAPDGAMSLLPFGALRRVEGDRAERLVERVEVVCVPSGAVLAALRRRDAPRDGVGVVGVADPTPGPGGKPLPASREEIDAILALHPPTRRTRLVGDDATETALRTALERPGGRLATVQLATHGVFDDVRPRLSGLVLAHGQRLLFDDVASWRVEADLVVLSGCNTAKGPLREGEGILGFPRAFFLAGCPRVVVSSWSVADASTAALMTAFHARMATGGLAPAAALRAVQAERAVGTGPAAHPNAWAAFQLWGLPE